MKIILPKNAIKKCLVYTKHLFQMPNIHLSVSSAHTPLPKGACSTISVTSPSVAHDHDADLSVHRLQLLQSGNNKDSRLAHTAFCLANDVHAQDCLRDALVLHWNREGGREGGREEVISPYYMI